MEEGKAEGEKRQVKRGGLAEGKGKGGKRQGRREWGREEGKNKRGGSGGRNPLRGSLRHRRHSPDLVGVRGRCLQKLERIRGFLKCYALYKSTFYLLIYLLT